MVILRTILALSLYGAATFAMAEPYQLVPAREPVMVELFTSEGCSSCPPAEARLNEFVDNEQLWRKYIPLAFHVDYWDYLGWKDPYADPAHSKRQRIYSARRRLSTVYTPAFVVNGKEWRAGWFGRQAPVSDESVEPLQVQIEDGVVRTRIPQTSKSLTLNVALLGMGLHTDIEAGENRGRRSTHEFVVLDWQRHDVQETRAETPLPQPQEIHAQRYALVVWLSDQRDPTPLYAAGNYLPASLLAQSR